VVLRVQYGDDRFDWVSDFVLDRLLIQNWVKRFYRPSEDRWVRVGVDPVRGVSTDHLYLGPERRRRTNAARNP
jgi:hypothetical protein